MPKIILYVTCIVLAYGQAIEPKECLKDHEVIKRLMKNYYKDEAPEGTVDNTVAMWLQDIQYICGKKQTGSISIYLTNKFRDVRLDYHNLKPCHTNISLSEDTMAKLWSPRLTVIDSRQFSIHESPELNLFTILFQNGTVWTATRAKMDIPCKVENKKKATCAFMQESFAGNNDKIRLYWDPQTPFSDISGSATVKSPWKLIRFDATRNTPVYPAGLWNQLKLSMKFDKEKKDSSSEEM